MNLLHLLSADIYRDGGSYGARFSGSDGLTYTLWLQRSAMPDKGGLHHRSLFLYAGETRPSGCKPIDFHSAEEHSIVQAIEDILAAIEANNERTGVPSSTGDVEHLRKMLDYIRIRDPW
jgi:hypothetical protein